MNKRYVKYKQIGAKHYKKKVQKMNNRYVKYKQIGAKQQNKDSVCKKSMNKLLQMLTRVNKYRILTFS
jgi:hypothetical protein